MSARASSKPELVCLGRVGAARGLKGDVRIRTFTSRARDIAAYGPLTDASGLRSFEVAVVAETEGGVVARLSGITDRDGAERVKGLELFVARAALPELPAGEFYQADLLGLAAEDEGGRPLGRVTRIDDFGAGAILEIEDARHPGRTEMWPANLISSVDLRGRKLVLAGREELVAASESRKAGNT